MHLSQRLASPARALLATAALLIVASASAAGQNIVNNPGFQSGFGAYTSPGIATGLTRLGLGSQAPSGGYELLIGSAGPANSLSQTLTTVAGQRYNISFYAFNPSPNDGINSFSVFFGGTQVFGQPIANTMYQQFTMMGTATSASTPFQFLVVNNADFTHIDDLSVTAGSMSTTPEPSTMALLGTGLAGIIPIARRRRRR